MTDLYRILKVERSASPEEITRAYRKLALKHHPDRGGDPEKMQEVQLAFEVLADPGRRAQYDRDGTFDRKPPPDPFVRFVDLIGSALGNVLKQLSEQGADPAKEDLIGHLRGMLSASLAEHKNVKAKFDRLIPNLKKALGRFAVDEGENLLENIVRSHVASAEQEAKSVVDKITAHEEALAFLKKCKYSHEARQQVYKMLMPGQWMHLTASTA